MGVAVMVLFAGHAVELYPTRDGKLPFIRQLDHIIYDTRLRLTLPQTVDENIVILDIDEKSLGEIGRWPWSRALMARLVEKLFDRYGIELLAFDVVWAERDTSSGIDALDSLAQNDFAQVSEFQSTYTRLRPALDNDGLFAESLKGRPVVLAYYFNSEARAVRVNSIPPPVLPPGSFAGRPVRFPQWVGYTGNLPAYTGNAAAAGHINPLVDDDGVSRRVPMLVEFDGAYYEPLSLAIVRTYLSLHAGGRPPAVQPRFSSAARGEQGYAGLEGLEVGPLRVPLDDTASALIPYRGGKHSFAYVSLADVVHDRVDPARLRGRIALVGASAPALLDLRATPVDSAYPGVEIHANLVSGMLEGTLKHKPGFTQGAELAMLAIAGLGLAVLIPRLSALWASAAALAAIALAVAFNFAAWQRAHMALPLASLLLMIAALYTVNMAYGYFVESRSRRRMTELFGQYVPPELVDRMAANPQHYMEPRSAELTILFSDVRGFTGIAETLPAEALREYINDYLTEMSAIIRGRHRGTLDKYMGDAIMAFWGAPLEDPQHARRAVLAGLDMQRQCESLNTRFRARGWPALRIGVGINTGTVRVGDMGSQVRRAYTAVGDAVNVASRLEGRTAGYRVGVLVGEATRRQVADVAFREVDRIRVRGKDEVLTIYEPLDPEAQPQQNVSEELAMWNATLRAYRDRRWDDAARLLGSLLRMNPGCGLYRAYSERLDQLRRDPPPPGWDGVTAYEDK